jgi:hypothetical protein
MQKDIGRVLGTGVRLLDPLPPTSSNVLVHELIELLTLNLAKAGIQRT